MTYYLVRLDTKEIFEERAEKPTETEISTFKNLIKTDILVIEGTAVMTTGEPDGDQQEPETPPDTIQVRAIDKFALAKVVGHDKKCPGHLPPGAPKLEPPKPSLKERVKINPGDILKVKAKAAYSCVDNPNTPEILATGNKPHYVVAEGELGEGQYVRADKVEVVSS